jgi:hydrogenase maturation protease
MNKHAIDVQPVSRRCPPRILVIGFGNPIRGDDALGPIAAERLEQRISSEQVQIISRHVLTSELVAEVSEADLVVFIDAAMEGPIGEVLCRPLVGTTDISANLAHFFDPRELLAWTSQLYGRHPEAYLVSVRGVRFDFAKYQLSPTVEDAVEPLLDQVCELIDRQLTSFRRTSAT